MESVTNMKKILYLLPLLLLFVPIRSYAVSTATLETIVQGLSGLETNGFSAYGVAPLLPLLEDDPYESYNSVLTSETGVSSLGLSMSDITEVNYDETFKDRFSDYTFHDKNGNSIDWDDIKLYEFENAFYHGYFFTDSNGDIIYDSSDNTLINYNYGGSTYSVDDIEGIYQNIIDTLNDSNMIYNPSGVDMGNCSYYMFNGVWDRGVIGAQYLYIPNVYQRGVCVISPNNSPYESAIDFYSNDSSLFHHVVTYDPYNNIADYPQYYNYWSLETGSYNVDGYTYKYHGRYSYRASHDSVTYPYSNWVNGTASQNEGLFGYSVGDFPTPEKFANAQDLTNFVALSTSQAISLTDTYSHDTLMDLTDAIGKAHGVPNSDFVVNNSISVINVPIVFPISISINVSVIPFPDVNEDEEEAVVDPSLDYPFDDSIDSGVEDLTDIPILSNLKNRFPFSIPWDIKNMLVNLRATPKAPVFDLSFTIPVINYEWETVVDLSSWNSAAELFRLLFLISFIIGLALFSYRHFFGS